MSAPIINLNRFGYFCHKCQTDKEDRMINCFACDANFHAKCIGLNGNMADKISADTGFHYYCDSHKNISVKSLLKKLSCFQNLNLKLKQLLEEFSEMSNYSPEELLKSLETKESMNKRMLSNFTSKKDDYELKVTTRSNKPAVKRKTETNSLIVAKKGRENDINILESTPESTPKTTHESNSQLQKPIEKAQNTPTSNNDMVNSPTPTFTSSSTLRIATQHQQHPQNEIQPAQLGRQLLGNRLRLASKPPKMKSLYISRLDFETTEDELKSYLNDVGGSDILKNTKIFKLSCRSKYFSSFKIICQETSFNEILTYFREAGAIAREFIYNNNIEPQASKN